MTVVALFGVVSLLADVSYEGLRSFLPVGVEETLALGGLVGVGELVAWGLRPLSGLLVDLTGGYWAAVYTGYALVPVGVLLAAASGSGALLAAGYWAERLGKAVRSPARDTLLGSVAPRGRRGLVFGLHELLDQLGAIAGPVMVYAIIRYGLPLWVLAVPGAFTVAALAAAQQAYQELGAKPRPRRGREVAAGVRASAPALVMVAVLGALTPNPLTVEHVASLYGVERALLPLVYMAAMASDAVAALPLGALYDKKPGLSIAAIAASVAASALVLLTSHTPAAVVAAALLAGVAEAGYETVARAMTRTATGYGLLGLARGVGYAASIIVYGRLALLLHQP
jgi:MFS family permease